MTGYVIQVVFFVFGTAAAISPFWDVKSWDSSDYGVVFFNSKFFY